MQNKVVEGIVCTRTYICSSFIVSLPAQVFIDFDITWYANTSNEFAFQGGTVEVLAIFRKKPYHHSRAFVMD